MDTWLTALISGLAVAGIGLLGNVILEWMRRRKTSADARSTESDVPVKIVGAAGDLAEQALAMVKQQQEQVALLQKDIESMAALKDENKLLRKEIEALKQEMRALHQEMAEWKRGARILVNQLKEVGIHPRWTPPKKDEVTGE